MMHETLESLKGKEVLIRFIGGRSEGNGLVGTLWAGSTDGKWFTVTVDERKYHVRTDAVAYITEHVS